MKCKYCKKESSSAFCSIEHKDKFNNGINEAIDKNCPTIKTRQITPSQLQMIEDFKRKAG